MKFLLYLFCILIFFQPSSFAVEEVLLQVDDNESPSKNVNKVFEEDDEYTLYERIQDIKAKEVKNTDSSAYLLDGILTKKFENIKSSHFYL